MANSIKIDDFKFWGNHWILGSVAVDVTQHNWRDTSTDHLYPDFNEKDAEASFLWITLLTPIAQTCASVMNVAYRALRLISFAHFWESRAEEGYAFTARTLEASKDLLRIIAAPFALIALFASSVYAWFDVKNGIKLYAAIERAEYGGELLSKTYAFAPLSDSVREESLASLLPTRKWERVISSTGRKQLCSVDETTHEIYNEKTLSQMRSAFLLKSLIFPIIYALTITLKTAYNILKLITLGHFWYKDGAKEAGKDLLRIVGAPLAYVGLLFTSFYGIASPRDARKLQVTIERLLFGETIIQNGPNEMYPPEYNEDDYRIKKLNKNHFRLFSEWTPFDFSVDSAGEDAKITRTVVQDKDRAYLDESKNLIRGKCFLLVFGTPLLHALATVKYVSIRLIRLITLYHLWKSEQGSYNFKARLAAIGKDLGLILLTPFTIIALEFAAIYGICRPYDGRKLYASLERFAYGAPIAAPCFQPDPAAGHLLRTESW
ncbi:MAG: hypothetical protein ACKVOH_03410 [Chlamydiales bacterium]